MWSPEETPQLSFFTSFLKFTGLWFGHQDGSERLRRLQYLRMVFFVLTVLFWDCLMVLQDPRELVSKPYTPVVAWCNMFLMATLTYIPKAAGMEDWVRSMASLLAKHQEPWQRDRFRQLTTRVWRFTVWYMIWQTLAAALATSIASILVDLVLCWLADLPEPFYIPIALEGLLAERQRSFTFYFLEFLNGILVILPIMYYNGILGMFVGCVLYIFYELEMCTKKIQTWCGPDNPGLKRKQLLKEVVDEHNEILRLTKVLQHTIAPCFTFHMSIASMVIGNFLYLSKKAQEENDVGMMSTQLYFSCIAIVNTFIPCFIGQLLSNQGEKFCSNLSKLNWYDKPPGVMKEYLMILRQVQNPILIDNQFKMPLSYVTFSDTMNKAYSLFILLDSIDN